MNIKKETQGKLEYYKKFLIDLQEVDAATLTKDARHYISDEISKAKRNIEYYSEIMKVLEGNN